MSDAHESPGTRPFEKRRYSRITFAVPAQLVCADGEWGSEVLDLSLKGALLRAPTGWVGVPGDLCTLRIPLDAGGESEIRMEAAVAHVGRDRIGLSCREIDLDSLTHLRRLIELNLADESLLQRELGKLMSD